ncbi:transcription-repair coupling factor [Candidatus Desantisbacteria bacterium CG_4_9_14_3_um_filter_40_11]|uniref:Transcription-repair-coupling factor n=4 Tax=unclassified Candidatus Desantisiibacteriota TaxID=3106372 RepID=A0A2M7JC22_9BACT|nr:MAG: transcription-repair coupling factor [Candidatus Desantisbacteria bacterium CG23_combo_of_CG06-09_8_20_14_all_40_23]PIX16903.1 MAG: transcription-repair coupling factor [Candidatus Desantisbacteria bacterium CG_4_8_14_3_um_filter_40_12]PIY19491.1 MAG: transcription-repair coupling factor [Candidatus Desantisbacteria bacterium CG_4_10_14_3_um_filter_40_18]PJB30335.1 MAG: transcription-repair coupling factor [Candidatus Desantisbacteria bacterium CG_4_9_14_3_um_filter_40_11]
MILSPLLPLLKNLNKYQHIGAAISSGAEIAINGLVGSSKAYLLSGLLEKLNKSVLIISPRIYEAEQLHEELKTFCPNKETVDYFPSLEVLAYEENPPADELIGQRFAILDRLARGEVLVLVTSLPAILYRITSPKDILNIKVANGAILSMNTLLEDLVMIGYERAGMTQERGDFSQRGGIVDVFPISSEYPVRIELFGDIVESIRQFDTVTQLSIDILNEVEIFPRKSIAEKTSTIFDYLPNDCLMVIDDRLTIEQEYLRLKDEINSLYQEACKERKVKHPEEIILRIEDILNQRQMMCLNAEETTHAREVASLANTIPSAFSININPAPNFGSKLEPLMQKLKEYIDAEYIIILSANYQGQAGRLQELLKEHKIEGKTGMPSKIRSGVFIVVSPLINGFDIPELRLLIMSDKEIFGKSSILRQRRVARLTQSIPVENFMDLKKGDFIVHIYYGIGQYLGLTTTRVEGKIRDFLLLEYAQGDKLYVPVDQLGLVHKYIGSKDSPPEIHRLHGRGWERTKEKVQKAVESMAGELIEIYAARKALQGHAFAKDTTWQYEFESGFVYEETPDQIKAIEEIKRDMENPLPMDRLVCGDVGYGKTEVAIRAAFKAVMDGKQVAVLVPTTILAFQHYSTFTERFTGFPVNIQMLSRFKSPKEQKEIISETVKGKVDIVIGTHRILQKDISFPNLGLVIIDEEHKFGVKHKERMKSYRKLVDVLTLTATPIPRTLHFSLCGIRDMSIIHTPPPGRLPIKTVIVPFGPEVIREAILREMDRGGQVFFVHNQVKSIPWILEQLNKIVPDARIVIAHGQMDEHELERVIFDFMEKKFDVLLASAIIESGLDMPNVNTIIINNAHRFGLAQLYQLRGRVGRAQHRAYAYLLHQQGIQSSKDVDERLQAMIEFSALGSGFNLSMRDLENRGAGNLLGSQQHGNVVAIGFEMYCHLLEETVNKLKGTPTKKRVNTKVTLPYESYIPEDYIQVSQERFRMYKRLASACSQQEICNIQKEFLDRFGKYPDPVRKLLNMMNIRMLAANAQILSISYNKGDVYLDLPDLPELATRVVEMVILFSKKIRLNPSHPNRLILKWEDEEKGMALLEEVIKGLTLSQLSGIVNKK